MSIQSAHEYYVNVIRNGMREKNSPLSFDISIESRIIYTYKKCQFSIGDSSNAIISSIDWIPTFCRTYNSNIRERSDYERVQHLKKTSLSLVFFEISAKLKIAGGTRIKRYNRNRFEFERKIDLILTENLRNDTSESHVLNQRLFLNHYLRSLYINTWFVFVRIHTIDDFYDRFCVDECDTFVHGTRVRAFVLFSVSDLKWNIGKCFANVSDNRASFLIKEKNHHRQNLYCAQIWKRYKCSIKFVSMELRQTKSEKNSLIESYIVKKGRSVN